MTTIKDKLTKVKELYLKTCENEHIDVNDIIFKDMNGYIPKEITYSLDEIVYDLNDNEEDEIDTHLLDVMLEYLLKIEHHFDIRMKYFPFWYEIPCKGLVGEFKMVEKDKIVSSLNNLKTPYVFKTSWATNFTHVVMVKYDNNKYIFSGAIEDEDGKLIINNHDDCPQYIVTDKYDLFMAYERGVKDGDIEPSSKNIRTISSLTLEELEVVVWLTLYDIAWALSNTRVINCR